MWAGPPTCSAALLGHEAWTRPAVQTPKPTKPALEPRAAPWSPALGFCAEPQGSRGVSQAKTLRINS